MTDQFAALVAANAPKYFLLRGIPVRFVGNFADLWVKIDCHVEIKPNDLIMFQGKRFFVTMIRGWSHDECLRIEFRESCL